MIILLISLVSLFFISNAFFVFKYIRLRKGINEYKEIGTGRLGFYMNCRSYRAIVYVKELDRFSNGYSSIKIDRIESCETGSYGTSQSISDAKNSFITIKLTEKIEWLESEENLKRTRKAKLEKLKNL